MEEFPRILKWKKFKLKPVMFAPRRRTPWLFKLVIILKFLFYYLWKIVCNTMLYMIFQYGWEPVLIHRILIGFEAILESLWSVYY